jgi:U4/U6 small nuclear ribonucleoprotein PRP4
MNEKITELETRREMRDVVVPVNDNEVRGLLRQVGEPVTLFGEREVSLTLRNGLTISSDAK